MINYSSDTNAEEVIVITPEKMKTVKHECHKGGLVPSQICVKTIWMA